MNHLILIEKVHLLESKLGEKWHHSNLEPFTFDSTDAIKVQNAARKIAHHIGLSNVTFFISYSQQKKNVGGHIDLNSSNNIFIEIDSNFKHDSEIVAAILAHEICHKYLHINNIKLFPEIENEILTDIATIYTGLGKLSLNGCESIKTPSNKTYTTTHTLGYLSREQFAFVYCLVCYMRKTSSLVMKEGLNSKALTSVENTEADSYFFKDLYFSNENSIQTIRTSYEKEIMKSQRSIAEANRHLRVIQEHIIPLILQTYKQFHFYIKKSNDDYLLSTSESVRENSHIYIKNLLEFENLKLFKSKVSEKESEITQLSKVLHQFIFYMYTKHPDIFSIKDNEILLNFSCPICENKMKIREKVIANVICKKCNYSFIVDTGVQLQSRKTLDSKRTNSSNTEKTNSSNTEKTNSSNTEKINSSNTEKTNSSNTEKSNKSKWFYKIIRAFENLTRS